MRIADKLGFFGKRKLEKPNFSHDEVVQFHKMLLKMKKRRPNLNVKKIMVKLYPNFIIKDNVPKSIL